MVGTKAGRNSIISRKYTVLRLSVMAAFVLWFFNIRILDLDAIPQEKHIICRTCLLNVAFRNNVGVLFIQLKAITNPVRLLTGDQGGAAASERIKNDAA
ncbi:MAG TPA: hypothetical protein PKA28_17890 [Methylomusa anaerophila]|nr:hypothetical protein [Methylomusa anaerophila]HML90315.1 hypothetical protein [Methylomusa anaerophila]